MIRLNRFLRLAADIDLAVLEPIRLWKWKPIGVLVHLSAKQ